MDSTSRTLFRTSAVVGLGDEQPFPRACDIISRWLDRILDDHGLQKLNGGPLQSRDNGTVRLWVQRNETTYSFALAYPDERFKDITWHVLTSIEQRDHVTHLDVEVTADGAPAPLAPHSRHRHFSTHSFKTSG